MQTLTLKIPDTAYQRFEMMAKLIDRQLEEIVLQTIQGNLPPAFSDLSPELQTELATWVTLSDEALWRLATEVLPDSHTRRQQKLLLKNSAGTLNAKEKGELARLRAITDQFVLRRSALFALLKWRGYALPVASINAISSHGTAH